VSFRLKAGVVLQFGRPACTSIAHDLSVVRHFTDRVMVLPEDRIAEQEFSAP
jgi:ABC-type microcin C transport system duplicated ATPase subunit YejF